MTTALGTYASTTALKTRLSIGTADTGDDTLLGDICDSVNSYIESVTGRVLGPIGGTATTTLTFDVPEPTRMLYVNQGIRGTAATVEVADYTGASYATVTSADVFLRPLAPRPGWPYTEVHLSDVPTGAIGSFRAGYATVRVTALVGFSAVPDEIEDVALTLAVRTWHARQAGQQDIVGTDEMGRPVVSRFMSARDRATLFRYAVPV